MSNKKKRPTRTLSIIVPLNNPNTVANLQRNKKLYYLLRWLRYNIRSINKYYRIEPQNPPHRMPHGAYHLHMHLHRKMEDFLTDPAFTSFISLMRTEAIAPAVHPVEHKTNGVDVILPPIRIIKAYPKPLARRDIPQHGTEIDLYHCPYFAREVMLIAPIKKPVDEYPVD